MPKRVAVIGESKYQRIETGGGFVALPVWTEAFPSLLSCIERGGQRTPSQ
jgi:hypothetical protein